jgi:hypothetical protein
MKNAVTVFVWVCFALLVLSVVLMYALVIPSTVQTLHNASKAPAQTSAAVTCAPSGLLAGGIGNGDTREAIAAAASASVLQNDKVVVIPLCWTGSEYMINFTAGGTPVQAVFDTGSAQFIVATSACASCTPSKTDVAPHTAYYQPTNAAVVQDPRLLPAQRPCTTTVSYVSQSNTVVVFADDVAFGQIEVPYALLDTLALGGPSPLESMLAAGGYACAAPGSSLAGLLMRRPRPAPGQPSSSSNGTLTTKAAPPLTISNFPVGGITNATGGSGSLNVFGMSSVMAATRVSVQGGTVEYLLPSCQVTTKPAYESPLLQAVSAFYDRDPKSAGTCTWSLYVDGTQGFVVFAPLEGLRLPSLSPVTYTPLVPALTKAASALASTPYRYYVVEVVSWTFSKNDYDAPVNIDGAPRYLVMDTGTTICMLPSARAVTTLQECGRRGYKSTLTLASINSSRPNPVISFSAIRGNYTYVSTDATAASVFGVMDSGTASAFSSDQDVGIFGGAAMQGLYLEFSVPATSERFMGFASFSQ